MSDLKSYDEKQPPLVELTSADSNLKRRDLKSVGLSVCFHVILLVAAALFVTNSPKKGSTDGDRRVSLVLATVNDEQRVEFKDQEQIESETSSDAKAEDALPDQQPELETPTLPDANSPLEFEQPIFDVGTMSQVPGIQSNKAKQQNLTPAQLAQIAKEQAELRARQPKGSPVGLSVFGLQEMTGRDFVFVLDRSNSMGEGGLGVLAQAATELQAAVNVLEENHKFQVVAYHHKPLSIQGDTRYRGGMLKASKENKTRVKKFVDGLAAFGGTEHENALMTAISLRPDVIVFMTDGGYPKLNDTQIGMLKRAARGQTEIHCVQFGSGALQNSDNFMNRLATANSGTFKYIDVSKWKKK